MSVHRDGVRRIYRIRAEGLEPLRGYVESFWDEALDAYRRSFDDPHGEEAQP